MTNSKKDYIKFLKGNLKRSTVKFDIIVTVSKIKNNNIIWYEGRKEEKIDGGVYEKNRENLKKYIK